jgi:hypothetical protein
VAHPQIAAFARLADGAAEPTRRIEGQQTKLSRTMHSINYDAIHDEIVVSVQFAQAIATFRGGAAGEEAPVRLLQGPSTRMRRPDQVAVDPIHNELTVAEGDAILTFPREANGDVAPIRVIEGPDTGLRPKGGGRGQTGSGVSSPPLAVDPVNNMIVVVVGDSVITYNRTDAGNVKPRTVISGPKSGLTASRGVEVDPERGWILAFITDRQRRKGASIGVWRHDDNGDVPPRFRIEAGDLMRAPRGLTLDPRNHAVIASDKETNSILTFLAPELFATLRSAVAPGAVREAATR